MNWNDYQSKAMRTQADQLIILERLWHHLGEKAMQLDNAARGLTDECGEVSSNVKRYIEYGQPLDVPNLREEVGDCLWRLSQVCDAVGLTLEECAIGNIAKLAERYPEKFSDHLAKEENRDRDLEAKAIDGSTISEAVMRQELARRAKLHHLLVEKAMEKGWVVARDGCLILPGDQSTSWASDWNSYTLQTGSVIKVPSFLERRMKEIEAEKAIEETYAAAVGEIEPLEQLSHQFSAAVGKALGEKIERAILEPPNRPEGEGWKFGSPDISGNIEYVYLHNVSDNIIERWNGYRVTENWGDETWWRVKPIECQCTVLPQIGDHYPEHIVHDFNPEVGMRNAAASDAQQEFEGPDCISDDFAEALYQNGNGFGEPPEEEDEEVTETYIEPPSAEVVPIDRERSNNYLRSCTGCGRPVHVTNQTNPLRCADCYKPVLY